MFEQSAQGSTKKIFSKILGRVSKQRNPDCTHLWRIGQQSFLPCGLPYGITLRVLAFPITEYHYLFLVVAMKDIVQQTDHFDDVMLFPIRHSVSNHTPLPAYRFGSFTSLDPVLDAMWTDNKQLNVAYLKPEHGP